MRLFSKTALRITSAVVTMTVLIGMLLVAEMEHTHISGDHGHSHHGHSHNGHSHHGHSDENQTTHRHIHLLGWSFYSTKHANQRTINKRSSEDKPVLRPLTSTSRTTLYGLNLNGPLTEAVNFFTEDSQHDLVRMADILNRSRDREVPPTPPPENWEC